MQRDNQPLFQLDKRRGTGTSIKQGAEKLTRAVQGHKARGKAPIQQQGGETSAQEAAGYITVPGRWGHVAGKNRRDIHCKNPYEQLSAGDTVGEGAETVEVAGPGSLQPADTGEVAETSEVAGPGCLQATPLKVLTTYPAHPDDEMEEESDMDESQGVSKGASRGG